MTDDSRAVESAADATTSAAVMSVLLYHRGWICPRCVVQERILCPGGGGFCPFLGVASAPSAAVTSRHSRRRDECASERVAEVFRSVIIGDWVDTRVAVGQTLPDNAQRLHAYRSPV